MQIPNPDETTLDELRAFGAEAGVDAPPRGDAAIDDACAGGGGRGGDVETLGVARDGSLADRMRAASSTLTVPMMFVENVPAGSSYESRTRDCAAR